MRGGAWRLWFLSWWRTFWDGEVDVYISRCVVDLKKLEEWRQEDGMVRSMVLFESVYICTDGGYWP